MIIQVPDRVPVLRVCQALDAAGLALKPMPNGHYLLVPREEMEATLSPRAPRAWTNLDRNN